MATLVSVPGKLAWPPGLQTYTRRMANAAVSAAGRSSRSSRRQRSVARLLRCGRRTDRPRRDRGRRLLERTSARHVDRLRDRDRQLGGLGPAQRRGAPKRRAAAQHGARRICPVEQDRALPQLADLDDPRRRGHVPRLGRRPLGALGDAREAPRWRRVPGLPGDDGRLRPESGQRLAVDEPTHRFADQEQIGVSYTDYVATRIEQLRSTGKDDDREPVSVWAWESVTALVAAVVFVVVAIVA